MITLDDHNPFALMGISYAFASGYGGQYVYIVPDLNVVMILTANSDIEISAMHIKIFQLMIEYNYAI